MYCPFVRDVEQCDRTYLRLPGLSNALHLGSEVNSQRHRCIGDSIESKTDIRRKKTLKGTFF